MFVTVWDLVFIIGAAFALVLFMLWLILADYR